MSYRNLRYCIESDVIISNIQQSIDCNQDVVVPCQ